MQEKHEVDGQVVWERWPLFFPPLQGTPGDGKPFPTLPEVLILALHSLKAFLLHLGKTFMGELSSPAGDSWFKRLMHPFEMLGSKPNVNFEGWLEEFTSLRKTKARTSTINEWLQKLSKQSSIHFIDRSIRIFGGLLVSPIWKSTKRSFYSALYTLLSKLQQNLHSNIFDKNDGLERYMGKRRRAIFYFDIALATTKGLIQDILKPECDFESIDHLEFISWLSTHDLHPSSAWCVPLRNYYDMGFAFEDGVRHRQKATSSAGVALQILLMILFSSKGSTFWDIRPGLGDAVFSPLYQVLKARGVRFAFFHRVKNLGLCSEKKQIATIEVSRQVAISDIQKEYDPLVRIGNLECWPSEPLWEQIQRGNQLKQKLNQTGLTLESSWCHQETERLLLRKGKDFDLVVLGIPIAALPAICSELRIHNEAWHTMLDKIKTVQTQNVQLWFNRSHESLGANFTTPSMTFALPFGSWYDGSFILEFDNHKAPVPKGLSYFTATLPEAPSSIPRDSTFPAAMKARQMKQFRKWLETQAQGLWPEAYDQNGTFYWDWLYDFGETQGPDRLSNQFGSVNIDPSERYTLSAPGYVSYRLAPSDSKFDNLILTGDWTLNFINAGNFEASLQSGLLAAQAICNECIEVIRPFYSKGKQSELV